MKILEVQQPRHEGLVGRRRRRAGAREGKDPFDWFLDFGLDGELDALVDCKLFNTDEDAVRELLRHPHAAIALSDAGAHLAFLCDAGFGLHLFGHWVRERGDLTLEQAVQSVTSRAAGVYRIKDRGRLVAGRLGRPDPVRSDRRSAAARSGACGICRAAPAASTRPRSACTASGSTACARWTRAAPIADCGRPGKLLRDFGRC